MKNNRLTNREVYELREVSKDIKELIKMETTSFTHDKEKDEYIKKTIRLWLNWFDNAARKIDDILETDKYKY